MHRGNFSLVILIESVGEPFFSIVSNTTRADFGESVVLCPPDYGMIFPLLFFEFFSRDVGNDLEKLSGVSVGFLSE